MKKSRKIILIVVIVILVILLIPKVTKEDGVKKYEAVIYTIDKHKDEDKKGTEVKLFGKTVYDNVKKDKKPVVNEELNFKWEPHVYNKYLSRAKGKEYEDIVYRYVEALLKGDKKVECSNEFIVDDLFGTLRTTFPPVTKIVKDSNYSDGYININYAVSDASRKKIIDDFANQVEYIINSSVKGTDTEIMKAIALYNFYVYHITYDANLEDVSTYQGIMNFSGICQSFGPAYAYLLMELGIDAMEVGALNEDITLGAHEWTIVNLNGKEYYADPTYECTSPNQGLKYFGLTSKDREEEGFRNIETTIGFNLIAASKYKINDNKFKKFREVNDIIDIVRKDGKMIINYLTIEGDTKKIVIDE